MSWPNLPNVGTPGSAASFQLERLRDWGLGDLADACTTREQALLAHHCALYVRAVWHERLGARDEPPEAAIRHCVAELIDHPEMLSRADRFIAESLEHEDRQIGVEEESELADRVAAALRSFR